jgi:hypothetical protein
MTGSGGRPHALRSVVTRVGACLRAWPGGVS